MCTELSQSAACVAQCAQEPQEPAAGSGIEVPTHPLSPFRAVLFCNFFLGYVGLPFPLLHFCFCLVGVGVVVVVVVVVVGVVVVVVVFFFVCGFMYTYVCTYMY